MSARKSEKEFPKVVGSKNRGINYKNVKKGLLQQSANGGGVVVDLKQVKTNLVVDRRRPKEEKRNVMTIFFKVYLKLILVKLIPICFLI